MKKIFIKDIRENQKLESTFLVKHKGVARTRTGNPYLNLTLGDTTGEIKGKVWDHAEPLAQRFQKDDFIRVQATAATYQNALQLTISTLTCCPPSEIDITDFLPQAKHDREETFNKLKTIITKVKNEHLRKLLDLFKATHTDIVISGHIHCHHVVCAEDIQFEISPATCFGQWRERWPDGDDALGFLRYDVTDRGIESTFIPLARTYDLEGYGPGGHPAPHARDYSVAWEKE